MVSVVISSLIVSVRFVRIQTKTVTETFTGFNHECAISNRNVLNPGKIIEGRSNITDVELVRCSDEIKMLVSSK